MIAVFGVGTADLARATDVKSADARRPVRRRNVGALRQARRRVLLRVAGAPVIANSVAADAHRCGDARRVGARRRRAPARVGVAELTRNARRAATSAWRTDQPTRRGTGLFGQRQRRTFGQRHGPGEGQ